ncbi:MAG: hypothetical protein GQ523_03100 [Methanophagales archaeon]|jgi:hypothetical protein|nr:hypothetical protein [Methanophagales archaeon]
MPNNKNEIIVIEITNIAIRNDAGSSIPNNQGLTAKVIVITAAAILIGCQKWLFVIL